MGLSSVCERFCSFLQVLDRFLPQSEKGITKILRCTVFDKSTRTPGSTKMCNGKTVPELWFRYRLRSKERLLEDIALTQYS